MVNEEDNCPGTMNTNQSNYDGDENGDLCDVDDDGDGIEDRYDNCQLNVDLHHPCFRIYKFTVLKQLSF